MPRGLAERLLHHLNLVGEHGFAEASQTGREYTAEERAWLTQQGADVRAAADSAALEHAHRLRSLATTTPDGRWRMRRASEGYVTLDACGGDDPAEQFGDDTAHRPYRSARQPVFVATALPHKTEQVDVVFFDFIVIDVLRGLNALGGGHKAARRYRLDDVERYVEWVSANTLMEEYAKRAWN